ncbi:2-hydroxyacid dehydrogenase [Mycoplasma phocimorsus]|uniref:2-hydroxyacid dehydrogenase n=1 Tax=Mycoplasma phocimorsus TaxID=3045839 RepID=UPI0024BFB273|nr:2-hydroxyacid dehydrogenase [Mycoplasma phocimorsus]MDJ1646238.1 2-hydroxyacid dehydrogenase [Mycoplasma phocimorsus]
MKIAFFDAKQYDISSFNEENKNRHEIVYFTENLTKENAHLAQGFDAVCAFVNTWGTAEILEELAKYGIKFWLQRSMGYDKVDLKKAAELGIKVYRVFNYSARAIAEHALTLMLALNRKLPSAISRVRKCNFCLNGLNGKNISESTVGVIGAGQIGQEFIHLVKGMGARVIAFDDFARANRPEIANKFGFEFVDFETLMKESDFVSLHVPSLPSTYHIINKDSLKLMKKDAIIINTARGALVCIEDICKALEEGIIGGFAADVLEREEGRFYEDLSCKEEIIKSSDKEWAELLNREDVIITSHQAFLTDLALSQIAKFTLENADCAQKGDFEKTLVLLENGKVQNG